MYRNIGLNSKGMMIVENPETLEIKNVNPPFFYDGEIVRTSSKHFSQKKLTRVLSPSYTDNRGWVYTENYINERGVSGGYGSWFEEELFEKIEDLETKLLAKKIELNTKIQHLNNDVKIMNKKKKKIEYALEI